jgi:hypothetical protein
MSKHTIPTHWEGTAATHIANPASTASDNATAVHAILVALENIGLIKKA